MNRRLATARTANFSPTAHSLARVHSGAERSMAGGSTTTKTGSEKRPRSSSVSLLHRRFGALHTELQKAEAALAQEASEHNLARLRDIQAQLSALEGTEAVIEGFGEASGRHRRDL